jgi:hypothetical protein
MKVKCSVTYEKTYEVNEAPATVVLTRFKEISELFVEEVAERIVIVIDDSDVSGSTITVENGLAFTEQLEDVDVMEEWPMEEIPTTKRKHKL